MRQKRIGDIAEQQPKREPSGAPSLGFELAFVAGTVTAAFVLYGKPRLVDLLIGWLS